MKDFVSQAAGTLQQFAVGHAKPILIVCDNHIDNFTQFGINRLIGWRRDRSGAESYTQLKQRGKSRGLCEVLLGDGTRE